MEHQDPPECGPPRAAVVGATDPGPGRRQSAAERAARGHRRARPRRHRTGPSTPGRSHRRQGLLPPITREALRRKGIRVVIPERSDQIAHRKAKGSAGGRPHSFDTQLYRDRNVVERAFNRLKGWRGIATRYDKKARNYRAGVILAGIVLFWLR